MAGLRRKYERTMPGMGRPVSGIDWHFSHLLAGTASAAFLDSANTCPRQSSLATKAAKRGTHQFEITKHNEPSSSAASSSAAHTTEIESQRPSLLWIMNPLPSRQRHDSGNSLLFHRECKKCPVCELGHCERRGRGRPLWPTGSGRPTIGTLELIARAIHFQLRARTPEPALLVLIDP